MGEPLVERRKIGFRFIEYEDDCDFHIAGAASVMTKAMGIGTGLVVVGAVVCSLIMDMAVKIPVTGKMAPTEEVNIFAKIEGPILRLNVKRGDVIKKGQVLAELDVRDRERKLAQLRLDLEKTQNELQRAEKELETTKSEYDNTLAKKKLQLAKARAALATQRARKVEELEVAKQKLAKETATAMEAKRKQDKTAALVKDGIVAKMELNQSRTDYKVAESNRQIAQRELTLVREKYDSQIRQAEVEVKLAELAMATTSTAKRDFIAKQEFKINAARTEIEKLTRRTATERDEIQHREIRSPIDGVILKEVAKTGGFAKLTEPLFVAADINDCVLKGYVEESRRRRLKTGQKAKLEFAAYKDVKFPAEVLKISPSTEMIGEMAMYEVRMKVDKPRKRPMFLKPDEEIVLLPGLSAKGDIYAERMKAFRYLIIVKVLNKG